MFFVGFSIFIIYAFFLARILKREKKQSYNPKLEVVEDFDGIGNLGRIPEKNQRTEPYNSYINTLRASAFYWTSVSSTLHQ